MRNFQEVFIAILCLTLTFVYHLKSFAHAEPVSDHSIGHPIPADLVAKLKNKFGQNKNNTTCVEYKTSYLPYTSSFLASNKGHLTKSLGKENPLSESLKNLLSEKQIALRNSTSVMERLDLLSTTILGVPKMYFERYNRVPFYSENSIHWEGFCEQWASASANRKANLFIKSTGDLVCDDVVITNGELRELVTAFYSKNRDTPPSGSYSSLDPKMISHPNTEISSKDLLISMTYSGLDKLTPQMFEETLIRNLENDQIVIVDIDSLASKWNHPVYQNLRCTTEITDSDLINLDMAKALPLQALTTESAKLNAFIKDIIAADQFAYKTENFNEATLKLKAALTSVKYEAPPNVVEQAKELHSEYFRTRHFAQHAIYTLIFHGFAKLDSNIKLSLVSNEMNFRIESQFASGTENVDGNGILQNEKSTTTYSHYEIQSKLDAKIPIKPIYIWQTPPVRRIDYMFEPWTDKDLSSVSEDLAALVEVVNQCKTRK